MTSTLINLGLFKLGWVACVFGAAAGMPVIGALTVALAVAVHLSLADNRRAEAQLLVAAAGIGLIWETILVSGGILDYGNDGFEPGLAPYWIVGMWVLFATTMNVGMRWLRKSTALAAVFGAVGGPMSFLAGERIGAVSFGEPVISLVVIGLGWALLLPLLVSLAELFETQALQPEQESA